MIKAKLKKLIDLIRNSLRRNPDRFLKEITGVVHVGANEGQERGIYESYGLEVIWIEPIPQVFNKLSLNIRDFKNQKAFQNLITDVEDKEYEFHVSSNNGASSSILDLKKHAEVWPSVRYLNTILLKSLTLTSFFKKYKLNEEKFQVLVLDTQGSELLVLEGSIPILNNFKYIKTEVPDFESYDGCCLLSDINFFMTNHGYKEFSKRKFASRKGIGNYYDVVYKKQT